MSACKVMITGASSFTGSWFVRALADAGHEICTVFTRSGLEAYDDQLRSSRVQLVAERSRPVFGCRFGDEQFLRTISEFAPDVLCHHAADVTNYRSPDFDFHNAVANNSHNIEQVLHSLKDVGCNRVVLTGTVFEGGEGAGSEQLPHFSKYGLSKALTGQVFQHFCKLHEFSLGKFVIPNPFGPFEEPRFTAYLVRTWRAGETPCVRTPAYIRDNIHASLLAKHYQAFVGSLSHESGFRKTNPSGYVESQGAFAQRFAREMEARLGMPCPVDLAEQTEFDEPRIRINTDALDAAELGWNATQAWDELADYYAPVQTASA